MGGAGAAPSSGHPCDDATIARTIATTHPARVAVRRDAARAFATDACVRSMVAKTPVAEPSLELEHWPVPVELIGMTITVASEPSARCTGVPSHLERGRTGQVDGDVQPRVGRLVRRTGVAGRLRRAAGCRPPPDRSQPVADPASGGRPAATWRTVPVTVDVLVRKRAAPTRRRRRSRRSRPLAGAATP
jgi:hypothetical protein